MNRVTKLILGFMLCALLAAQGIAAQEKDLVKKEPTLRLNSLMHQAVIHRIATDSRGRYAITASDDKTARLWDTSSGELIQTFRPPLDTGNEGKLYACALSPDGSIAVIGGYSGWDWYYNTAIYIFDTRTGAMINRYSGFGNIVVDLEFSPSGAFLAVGCDSTAGVTIIDTKTWTELKKIPDSKDGVFSMSFAADGRFATASDDGYIRTYTPSFTPEKTVRGTGGDEVHSLQFSPDGTKLAVGYLGNSRIQVLDSRTLATLYEPNTSGTDASYTLNIVAWSRDGANLYAGGFFMKYEDSSWKSKLRAWDQGGKGAYRDYTAGENRIYDIKILPDETLLIAGGLPEWIRMKRSGETLINKKAENYNFLSRDTTHLKVTPDGQSILFKPLGGPSCAFSVATETFTELKDGEASPFPLAVAAKTEAPGISLTDWNLTTQPKLNGKAFTFLARGERTSSVAISGRTNSIIVGADYNLYGVSYSGAMLWKVATPSTIYAVNVADSIQAAVASLGDGTIRWYRISDGKELLALYVNKITKRWILWTPSGYFNASPGGSTLVGWHMNNGINKASDFFSADRFSDRYYRPEITKSVLQYGDELVAVNEANKDKIVRPTTSIQNALPPVVSLIAPSDGEDISTATVKVSALIRAPKGTKVTEIKTLVDGRPVENNTRGIEIRPKDDAGEVTNLTVTIPDTQSGTYRISVLAKNENGWSEPSTVRVRLQATESFSIKPKLYVLSVGVGKYDDAALTLKYPAKDAMDFANALKRQSSLLYREVVVKTLVDKQATKDDVLDGLDWIQQETTAKDIAMVFFAGHGVNDQNGIFYFLPSDADTQRLKRTCVPFTDIKNTVSSLAGKALFFVDTCHSGNVMGARRGAADIAGMVNELARTENGVVVFASSTGSQYSQESDEWQNGAFTKALIEGIQGKADYSGVGKITVNMLDLYLSERVKELTKGKQTPTTTKPENVPDFPIAAK